MNDEKIYSIIDEAVNEIRNDLQSDIPYDSKDIEKIFSVISCAAYHANASIMGLGENYIDHYRNACPLTNDIPKVDAVIEYHRGHFDYDMICDVLGYNPSKLIFVIGPHRDGSLSTETYNPASPSYKPNLTGGALCIWIEK
jgi:hypothetical protein